MTRGKGPSALEMLAENLRTLRATSGLSVRALADKLGWDHAHLHKMENGKSRGSEALIEALDTFYETRPHLKQLWVLSRQIPFVSRYEKYMELEAKARLMYQYAPSVIPGLLQTEGYARELLNASGLFGDGLDDQVTLRLDRQEKILTDEDPAEYRAIIDEAALSCPLRDREEWRKQLAHLVTVAKLPNVTIQVLLRSAGLHGLADTDTMFLRLPKGASVAYTETGYSGDLVQDAEEVARLQVFYDRLRDKALSPPDSVAFIEKLMEDLPCEPPDPA
jgi:transcriptional regulator with XRE-family HTH domain